MCSNSDFEAESVIPNCKESLNNDLEVGDKLGEMEAKALMHSEVVRDKNSSCCIVF